MWGAMDTPVYWFALTTYHFQLVLVGGREYVGEALGPVTNKLWTLDEQIKLQETLPPMTIRCFSATAVSHGDHLLVAGGNDSDGTRLDVVEVYSKHIWFTAQPLPKPCTNMKSTVRDGHWYLMGGFKQGTAVYYASLDSLIASCQPSETSQTSSIWKRLPDIHSVRSTPSVFGKRLTTIGGSGESNLPISSIHAFSTHTQSWVHVGDLPVAGCSTCTIVLPSGELLVMGGFLNSTNKVFKATLIG